MGWGADGTPGHQACCGAVVVGSIDNTRWKESVKRGRKSHTVGIKRRFMEEGRKIEWMKAWGE